MTTAEYVLNSKNNQLIHSISPDNTVFEGIQMMSESNIGALLVIEDERLVGIISERDYVKKVVLENRSSKNTCVSEIMTANVHHVHPDSTIIDCMSLITEMKIRHLPVMENDMKLRGVISIGDIVKVIIADKDLVIDHLIGYITGSPSTGKGTQ